MVVAVGLGDHSGETAEDDENFVNLQREIIKDCLVRLVGWDVEYGDDIFGKVPKKAAANIAGDPCLVAAV